MGHLSQGDAAEAGALRPEFPLIRSLLGLDVQERCIAKKVNRRDNPH